MNATVNQRAKRGPKKKAGVRRRYDVRLYLWEGEDDDLIAFFESIPSRQRPSGLKLALRSGNSLSNLRTEALEEDEDDMDFDMEEFLS